MSANHSKIFFERPCAGTKNRSIYVLLQSDLRFPQNLVNERFLQVSFSIVLISLIVSKMKGNGFWSLSSIV